MKQYSDIMDTYRTPRTEGYQESGETSVGQYGRLPRDGFGS